MVKVLFCTLKGGGWSIPHREKPDLIITTGIAWSYRVTFNSQLGIIPAGLFFYRKGDKQHEKRTDSVSYTHLDVYKRQELIAWADTFDILLNPSIEDAAIMLNYMEGHDYACLLYTSHMWSRDLS